MKKLELIEKYGEEWYKEHILKPTRKRNQEHKEEKCEYMKQWYLDNKEEKSEYNKQWREDNPNYDKQYRQDHKEEIAEYKKQWCKDNPIQYRASHLLNAYRQSDKDANRGECTLTADWIINNIFTSKCVFCGETDWTKLGCDRINNTKPHTVDNVQCCCGKCNVKRGVKSLEEFLEKK